MMMPTYGDTVVVKTDAPCRFHPGQTGTVVSIYECQTIQYSEKTGVPIGEIALGVEFSNGDALEIPLSYVQLVENISDSRY